MTQWDAHCRASRQLKQDDMINYIKRIVASIRDKRDRRFRERIDRVYFRHDGKGVRYFDGLLVAVMDEKTGQYGGVVSGGYISLNDWGKANSAGNYSDFQSAQGSNGHSTPSRQ